MNRITPKEVQSMMEAYSSVHEVEEQDVISEETLAQKNARIQKENEEKLAAIAFLRRQRRERNQKPPRANLPSDLKDTEQTATAAGQKVAGKVSGSLPADYKETELQAGKDAEKSRTGAGLPQSGGGNQSNYGKGSTTTSKPQLTDQQKVRAEYDRLRKKDPKTGKVMGSPEDLKKAAAYGMAMSKAGAANKDFSGYKSAADLAKAKSDAKSNTGSGGYQLPAGARPITKAPISTTKPAATATSTSGLGGYQLSVDARPKSNIGRVASNLANSDAKPAATSSSAPAVRPSTAQVRGREAMMAAQRNRAAKPAPTPAVKAPATPAAKPAGSIADRLQQIRDMRARSQSRITAQGGTPATPTVKASAPSTTGATTTPTVKPAAKVDKKQPLKNGDPMERMTGKGAASLMETYSKVYEEREPQAIDEGIMGALAKVGQVVAEEKTAADPGMKKRMGQEAPKKGGYKLPERTPANAKNVEYYKDDADLFDIIKGHFIEEGLTEEEALAKMFELTEDERQSILEGLPRSVTVIPPADMKDPEERKAYVKQRGAAAREDIKRQDAGKVGRVNGKIPEFRVK